MSECFFDEDGGFHSSPKPEAIDRLREILKAENMEDLVWGPELESHPIDGSTTEQVRMVGENILEKDSHGYYSTGHVCLPGCKGGIGPCIPEEKKHYNDFRPNRK